VDETEIKKRVTAIAEMLELTATLSKRASGLTADGKQKISLGRGPLAETERLLRQFGLDTWRERGRSQSERTNG
jgi:ABC-type sugar transport system ATPase subunit